MGASVFLNFQNRSGSFFISSNKFCLFELNYFYSIQHTAKQTILFLLSVSQEKHNYAYIFSVLKLWSLGKYIILLANDKRYQQQASIISNLID